MIKALAAAMAAAAAVSCTAVAQPTAPPAPEFPFTIEQIFGEGSIRNVSRAEKQRMQNRYRDFVCFERARSSVVIPTQDGRRVITIQCI